MDKSRNRKKASEVQRALLEYKIFKKELESIQKIIQKWLDNHSNCGVECGESAKS